MPRRGLPDSIAMRHDEHYVEALAASAGTPVGRLIPIDLIDPNPNQPRQVMGDLSELMASISEKGIIEPLVVRPRGERFQIVAGERRYQAAVQLGLKELPAVIRDPGHRLRSQSSTLCASTKRSRVRATSRQSRLKSAISRFISSPPMARSIAATPSIDASPGALRDRRDSDAPRLALGEAPHGIGEMNITIPAVERIALRGIGHGGRTTKMAGVMIPPEM